MELFLKDFVPELNTKNLGNVARRFRSYGILMIDVAAEFCTWIEQRHNRSSIPSLGLAETPEVPNTVSEVNSLSFPMVHQMAPNS
jgi:hypothetical protein